MAVWLSAEVYETNTSVINNTSDVVVNLYVSWNYGSWNHTYPGGAVYIDGTEHTFWNSFNLYNTDTGTELLASFSQTVAHNADGTKTVSCSAWYATQVSSGTIGWSADKVLATIPRASTPTLNYPSITMGDTMTITTNRASSSFTHTLSWKFGSRSGTIATGVGASTTWQVPLSLSAEIPTTTSGTGTITCKTYNGSTLVGTTNISFTAVVPASVKPVLGDVTFTETVAGLATDFGVFVQGKSKVRIDIKALGGDAGTSIKSIVVTANGQRLTGVVSVNQFQYSTSVTTDALRASGTNSVVIVLTDSRGRTTSATRTISVVAYSAPSITKFSVERCNASGQSDYEGTRVKCTFAFSISPVSNKNQKYYEIVYRKVGDENWSAITSGQVYTLDTSVISSAAFDADYSWEVKLDVFDYFDEAASTITVPTAFTLVDYRATGRGIAFGKVSEKNAFEVAIPLDIQAGFVEDGRINATLKNSWVNYSSGYRPASYYRDPAGVVHLAGLIKGGTTSAETVLFTLPAGYRPSVAEKFFCVSMNAICVIDVYNNGDVAIKAGANAGWVSLSGVSFKAG